MRRGWVVLPAVVAALAATTATAGAQVNAGHSGWNWGNPQPQGNTINDISFNAGTGFAGGDFGTLLSTIDGGQTWTGVATGITPNITRSRSSARATSSWAAVARPGARTTAGRPSCACPSTPATSTARRTS